MNGNFEKELKETGKCTIEAFGGKYRVEKGVKPKVGHWYEFPYVPFEGRLNDDKRLVAKVDKVNEDGTVESTKAFVFDNCHYGCNSKWYSHLKMATLERK